MQELHGRTKPLGRAIANTRPLVEKTRWNKMEVKVWAIVPSLAGLENIFSRFPGTHVPGYDCSALRAGALRQPSPDWPSIDREIEPVRHSAFGFVLG
jgi:hypothetical protein